MVFGLSYSVAINHFLVSWGKRVIKAHPAVSEGLREGMEVDEHALSKATTLCLHSSWKNYHRMYYETTKEESNNKGDTNAFTDVNPRACAPHW